MMAPPFQLPSNVRAGPTDADAFCGHKLSTPKGTLRICVQRLLNRLACVFIVPTVTIVGTCRATKRPDIRQTIITPPFWREGLVCLAFYNSTVPVRHVGGAGQNYRRRGV
ncbi:unnamed protein product [Ectocarpus sp. 12 AP-2014]